MRSGLGKKLGLLGLTVVVALGLAELGLRLLGVVPPGFQPYPSTHARGLFVLRDDARGYGYAPGFRCEVTRAGRKTEVAINASGFRDRPFDGVAGEGVPGGARRVLTVGCSLTAGWGLEAEEAWPRQLELLLAEAGPVRVFNAGVTGYNMRQARATAEQLFDALRPDEVVMGLYPMGHDRIGMPFTVFEGWLVRDAQVPRLRLEDDGFFQSLFRSPGWQDLDQALHHYFRVGAFVMRAAGSLKRAVQEPRTGPDLSEAATRRGLDPLLAEVGLLRDACRSRGIGFRAVVISVQEDDGSFSDYQHLLDRLTDEYCRREQIEAVPTLATFAAEAGGAPVFKLPGDLHWSARAHRRAAELLAASMRGR